MSSIKQDIRGHDNVDSYCYMLGWNLFTRERIDWFSYSPNEWNFKDIAGYGYLVKEIAVFYLMVMDYFCFKLYLGNKLKHLLCSFSVL